MIQKIGNRSTQKTKYFYINGKTLVLLVCCSEIQKRNTQSFKVKSVLILHVFF